MTLSKNKERALKKILNSKEFARSYLSKRLLKYLVDASEQGISPKEITIAIEVFGKDQNYDPTSDSYVRSFIYKIRKKLEHYYEHEGKDDKVQIVIPPGQYCVEFHRIADTRTERSEKISLLRKYKWLALALIILVFIVGFYFTSRKSFADRIAESPVWEDLFRCPQPVMIVTGNVFSFLEYRPDLDSWRTVAEPYVINADDFEQFKKKHPQEQLYYTSFSYLPENIIDALVRLVPIFAAKHKELKHQLASRLQWDDIRSNTIVYIGGTSGLYILKNIISLTHFRYRPVNKYFIINAKNDTLLRCLYKDPGTLSQVYRDEYAFVAKVWGPNNNVIYFFIGMDFNSRTSSVRKMLDVDFLSLLKKNFIKRFGHFPKYFEVLWKVGGFKEADFSNQIIYFNSLEDIYPQ